MSNCHDYPRHHPGVCSPYHHSFYGYLPMPSPAYPWCPVCCQPYHLCTCAAQAKHYFPKEITADPESGAEALVGGADVVRLTLEYMPLDGATEPDIHIAITDGEVQGDWQIGKIAAGYHVKSEFAAVAPGAKLKVEVKECLARLRWFETVK